MTFGEKLKQARVAAGLSQEQLSEQIGVSRSAVAKWESDKGMPDIQNLKVLAQLLNTSIDYLLDDGETLDLSLIRKPVDLSAYGKGIKKAKKDRLMRQQFPNAKIMTLMAEEKLTKGEKVADGVVFWLTPLLEVIPFAKALNNLDNEFYLVEENGRHQIVMVTKEWMEIRTLPNMITEKKFEIGNYKFTNCGPIHYA